MKREKRLFGLLAMLVISFSFALPVVKAQVNVGKGVAPHDFSILELSTDKVKGGLRLPQLNNEQRDALIKDSEKDVASGLLIYNTESECLEFWNGSKWISLCVDIEPTSAPQSPKVTPAAVSNGNDSDTLSDAVRKP